MHWKKKQQQNKPIVLFVFPGEKDAKGVHAGRAASSASEAWRRKDGLH